MACTGRGYHRSGWRKNAACRVVGGLIAHANVKMRAAISVLLRGRPRKWLDDRLAIGS
jgi:hypothetical protein